MEIRFAQKNDNMRVLASLLYNVDPYIYPYWFKNNFEDAVATLQGMLGDESSIFYYKNCIIAKDGDNIVGIFSFVPANASLSRDYNKWDKSFESHHVITYYILNVIDNIKANEVCIVGLYVDPKYRRKNIASKMFNYFFANVQADFYSLEVLANNEPALNLYNKYNFEITKTYNGYNGYKKRKPLCHIMIKNGSFCRV